MPELQELGEYRCLVLAENDAPLLSVRDATDLIGQAMSEGASVVAVPVESLDPTFFQLRSGFAGDVLQKAANYRLRFAVIGDVSAYTAASQAFRDLVVESTRSSSFFFLPDIDALKGRLAQLGTDGG